MGRAKHSFGVAYPEIVDLFEPELRNWPVEDVEALLRQQLAVDSIESFGRAFNFVTRSAKQLSKAVPLAMPVVGAHMALAKRALPALRRAGRLAAPLMPLAGQVAGTVLGGPAGAMVGGAIGNIAGGALGGTQSTGAQAGAVTGLAGPMLAAAPAAAQLMGLLGRPEVTHALTSMALGPAGNPNVQVGMTEVPIAAFANLIGSLANQATEQLRLSTLGAGEAMPGYLLDDNGELYCDPASPEARAEVLYELLMQAESTSLRRVSRALPAVAESDADAWDEMEPEDETELYDSLDLCEMFMNEAFE